MKIKRIVRKEGDVLKVRYYVYDGKWEELQVDTYPTSYGVKIGEKYVHMEKFSDKVIHTSLDVNLNWHSTKEIQERIKSHHATIMELLKNLKKELKRKEELLEKWIKWEWEFEV